MTPSFIPWHLARATVAALLASQLNALHAQPAASNASAASALPIAVSVAAPAALFVTSGVLTLVAADVSAGGIVWVLERASDGARATLRLSSQAAGGVSVAAGALVTVTALSTGWVLSQAGRAIAFVPNQIGAALLYDERVTR